ncbi:uncharacterized protein LOC135078219 [Ostrinia nubilalis]|uniref:uncharacterized protein LOC135078219 n=1 Tax=Ostrinia nubilalis TaxID=29057 RepID=UPI003082615E
MRYWVSNAAGGRYPLPSAGQLVLYPEPEAPALWVHTGLQIMGSVLALVGCFIKILDVGVNFTTYHAQFALASMIFTTVSLVNGVASSYAYELRKCIPGILSKLTHICFGLHHCFHLLSLRSQLRLIRCFPHQRIC